MRRKAKVDANHAGVVAALRSIGCSVQSLAAIGKGCPDLLVARGGLMWLMEVKDGDKAASRIQLTPDQKEWMDKWRGNVYIVTSAEHAMQVVNGVSIRP